MFALSSEIEEKNFVIVSQNRQISGSENIVFEFENEDLFVAYL